MGYWSNVLQIISLNILVDVIRVPKAPTSGEYLPIKAFARGAWRNLIRTVLEKILKLNIIVKEKRDVGMAKCFSKNNGKHGMSFQLPAIQKLCQDACQRLMLHPYVTASRTIVNSVLS